MVEDKKNSKQPQLPHNIILENRKKLNISGVRDVDSFDEQSVVVYTDMVQLVIRGSNIHIGKLSVETGELLVEGEISSLTYAQASRTGGGFFSKMFR